MLKKVKENSKIILAFILGFLLSGITAYAATLLSSSEVSYDNSNSGSSKDNVQGAIEELYTRADECESLKPNANILSAYTYNQTSGASDYCITGKESTCQKTDCYNKEDSNSCKKGTIIQYKVNSTDTVTFHVMYDEGETLTLQSQRQTISGTGYATNSTDGGPLIILPALESATKNWTNVKNQTYTLGTTIFKTNAYTQCSSSFVCTSNRYMWNERTARARMITVQEAVDLGCTGSNKTCPVWMINYSYSSTSYGGTENDKNNDGYWTVNAADFNPNYAYYIECSGRLYYKNANKTNYGARAVVVINK